MATPEERAKEKIDSELKLRGWEELSKENGTGYKKEVKDLEGRRADYVLYIDGTPFAVIEAKKANSDVKNHLQQARHYAKDLTSESKYNNIYSVPFLFSSNGSTHIVNDLRKKSPTEHEIRSFYSPEDLQRKLRNDYEKAHDWLQNHTYEDMDPNLRENQQEGLKAAKDAILEQRNKLLITMATGSGKTRLAMALVYQLLESGFANRILFVPDTEQLERDAKSAFKSYDPIGPKRFNDVYTVSDFNEYMEHNHADVVVSTIQKASYELNEHEEDRSPGEFDVIIADECHRGIYNKEEGYGKVLDFYDGVEIGLTATPHEKTLERYGGHAVYEYDYKDALDDNYVVPFTPYVIKTKITMDGYGEYSPSDFGRNVLIHDTHQKVAKEVIDAVDNIKDDLTLVFAQNIKHAKTIRQDFIKVLREKTDISNPEDFVETITSQDRHAESVLEDFKNKRRKPKIAVTVDMVSTGVDVKPLNNLVFLRAIKSKILYNQMMGRGTRTTPDKTHFRVFDCLGLLEYHSELPPFNTRDVQYNRPEHHDSGEASKTINNDTSPEEVQGEVDEVISSYEAYPIPGDFVSAEIYLKKVTECIEKNKFEIIQSVEEENTINKASESIESVLQKEYEYYQENYILKAKSGHYDNLLEYTSDYLFGEHLIKRNSTTAVRNLKNKHNLNSEQIEWVEKFGERAAIENKPITTERLLKKPFSDMGGYDRAKTLFSDPNLEDILNEFNSNLLSLSGA